MSDPSSRPWPRRVAILGGGVAGLALASRLRRHHHEPGQEGQEFIVTLFEARDRLGGRNVTLRAGDKVVEEDKDGARTEQTFRPKADPTGAHAPHLNAGPGRIPTAHKRVLAELKRLGVKLEPYIMESRSNRMDAPGGNRPVREYAADIRGRLAEKLWAEAPASSPYAAMLSTFGQLNASGQYVKANRRGYSVLPGVSEGAVEDGQELEALLSDKFWERNFFQPQDFLWQQTSLQPTGGMDQIVKKYADELKELGVRVALNAPARRVARGGDGTYLVDAGQPRGPETFDVVVSNIPIPLLKGLYEPALFDEGSAAFRDALAAVIAQNDNADPLKRFLQPTCKVGWQARRALWQEDDSPGGVPIYGGISRTTRIINQIWYPSDDFHAELGVLTGAYNYGEDAVRLGELEPKDRLDAAREGAARIHGQGFADQLEAGVSIAWQNMPHLKGGWASWNHVPDGVKHYNALLESANERSLFVCGDQVSQLPGWQEGAIASAWHIYEQLTSDVYMLTRSETTPDTRSLIEGY